MDAVTASKIMQIAVTQGPWAVLFVALLFYVLRENNARENRYLDCIHQIVTCIQTDMVGVKADVAEVKSDVTAIKAVVMHDN